MLKKILITYLEVVLELESLSAVGALEPPEDGGLVVRDHVPLQPVHVGELLLAHLANLQITRATNRLRGLQI